MSVDPRCKPVEPLRLMLFYCPTCNRMFGRGKGAFGLAKHYCPDPATTELRAELRQHLAVNIHRRVQLEPAELKLLLDAFDQLEKDHGQG